MYLSSKDVCIVIYIYIEICMDFRTHMDEPLTYFIIVNCVIRTSKR